MPNGSHGDHPLTDILLHKTPTFSPIADNLIIQIDRFVSREQLHELFPWFSPPEIGEFERQLADKLEQLQLDAKNRGWDITGQGGM